MPCSLNRALLKSGELLEQSWFVEPEAVVPTNERAHSSKGGGGGGKEKKAVRGSCAYLVPQCNREARSRGKLQGRRRPRNLFLFPGRSYFRGGAESLRYTGGAAGAAEKHGTCTEYMCSSGAPARVQGPRDSLRKGRSAWFKERAVRRSALARQAHCTSSIGTARQSPCTLRGPAGSVEAERRAWGLGCLVTLASSLRPYQVQMPPSVIHEGAGKSHRCAAAGGVAYLGPGSRWTPIVIVP